MSNPIKSRSSKRFHLRAALVVPFTIQILVAVGLVGYLSFRNGQKAIDELNGQLQNQAQARIRQRLESYLATPPQVNKINLEAIQRGLLKPQDQTNTTHYLWRQMETFQDLSYIDIGAETGEFLGVGREDNRDLYVELMKPDDRYRYNRYALDGQGNPTQKITNAVYEFKNESWYKNAIAAGRPVWSAIYQWADDPEIMSISCSYPIIGPDKQTVGVVGIDFALSQISTFLRGLKISKSGQVFIMERDGLMVASSSPEKPFSTSQGKAQRLSAFQSQDRLIRATALHLKERFGDLNHISGRQEITFKDDHGERLFAWVEPWKDQLGLDWLVAAAVPESDFMGQINANTRNTLILCLAALAGAVSLGIYSARWIIRPVSKLNDAANQIAAGNLDQHVALDGLFQIVEIDNLADSFNSMSSQLKASFASLEAQKNSFARFFPQEYLKFLDKQGVTDVKLGDHISKDMAVMFSDIRSFTMLSEKMTPKENFDFVNAYLQKVSPEIRAHNGFVVKFLGDGMMAVFPNGVDDAVAAGVAKLKKVHEYNRQRQAEGALPIDVGMGINVGHMMVGMVGEHNRIQGDAFSDNVNLTARLEGLTKFYGVSLLISEDVLTRLRHREQYNIRFLDRVIVKGRKAPIAIYEILDAQMESVRALKLQTQADFDRGIADYRAGNLTGARELFLKVLTINPSDKTAELYLKRVEKLAEQGVPENWDGIWAFSEK